MEVRTRKIIRTRVFGTGTYGRPLGRDPTVLYIRYAQPKSLRKVDPPRYKIIEPKKPKRPRLPSDTSIRTSSPARSRPLRFRFPFLSRISASEQESELESEVNWDSSLDTDASTDSDGDSVCRPRGRDRSHRLFVISKADELRRRTLRSPSPKIRFTRKVPFGSNNTEYEFNTSPFAGSRQPSRGSRQQRERTPTPERESSMRGGRVVEIPKDHRTSPCEGRGHSPGRRRVRFASEVQYVRNTNKAKEARVRELERHHVRPTLRRGIPVSNLDSDHDAAKSGATCHLHLSERKFSERGRPRIIQDGNRHMSDAAERIRKEAWRRHSRENLLRDLKSYRTWRRCTHRSGERI
ncbi:hypothetical protein BDV28DRAFT_144061 [Aspergillus coremiiformis]|uniref:Uncharacterized protein n=1 Tax=Aspergillus coremiiformis TaxID=138285 RepID=A0A5N6YX17_9EURO|nr:hypothetical protein BDV28DRAFT_144061 [Aspergillus coremiiformis]